MKKTYLLKNKDQKEEIPVIDIPLQKVLDKHIKKEPDLVNMIWFGLMTPQETAKKLNISLRGKEAFRSEHKKLEYSLNDYKKANEQYHFC